MIRGLELENFQSHEKTVLELPGGMIVIYGTSDNGKSSIIRGIQWCVLNRPNGDDFRRHHTKKTFVTIKTDNWIVERRKSDSKNEYEMDEKVYKALRSSVPEDISTALNLDATNIQLQHEVYFLVDKSPGQVSKKLNEVAGLEIMDKVLKQVNSDIRAVNANVNTTNKLLIDTQKDIYDLEWVDGADKFLKKLEDYESKIKKYKAKFDKLQKILIALEWFITKKNEFVSNKCIADMEDIYDYMDKIHRATDKWDWVLRTVNKITKLKHDLANLVCIDITELENMHISLRKKQKRYNRICKIISNIEALKKQHKAKIREMLITQKEYKRALKKLGVCPTCERKI